MHFNVSTYILIEISVDNLYNSVSELIRYRTFDYDKQLGFSLSPSSSRVIYNDIDTPKDAKKILKRRPIANRSK